VCCRFEEEARGVIPLAAFESLCVGVESYVSINQLNWNCGNNIRKKDLAQLVNAVVSAPYTRKCLSDPKVSKSLGDRDDKYYNSIQVANDHAVHMLNEMGYAGHLLAVKIEDDREEAVPLTQPQSKE